MTGTGRSDAAEYRSRSSDPPCEATGRFDQTVVGKSIHVWSTGPPPGLEVRGSSCVAILVLPVEAAVLDGFGEVVGGYVGGVVDVGDGSSQAEDLIVGTSGEAHFAHGLPEQ